MKRQCHGALLSVLLLPIATHSEVGKGLVDGNRGMLHVFGALSESPCRMDMTSAWQDVDIGTTETADLGKPGDRGHAVPVQLRLHDCTRSGSEVRNEKNGNLAWSSIQPVAVVTFHAPTDADSPQLVRVEGAHGLGLRLLDAQQHDVLLGSRMRPQFLASGENQLTYYVQPERTPASMQPGNFRAVIHFRMNYD